MDSDKRAEAAAMLEKDKVIITSAGTAVEAAQQKTAAIVADMTTLINQQLAEAIALVTSAMNEARQAADEELMGVFVNLESSMNTVAKLGGTEGFATGWWEEFKQSVGPLSDLFDEIDGDESGKIGKEELKVALMTSDSFRTTLEMMGMDDSESIFTAIDLDDSLEITCKSVFHVCMMVPNLWFLIDRCLVQIRNSVGTLLAPHLWSSS
eukprot:SAG31_NODE_784_length_12112_cov_10.538666_10_plen_209_part_00